MSIFCRLKTWFRTKRFFRKVRSVDLFHLVDSQKFFESHPRSVFDLNFR